MRAAPTNGLLAENSGVPVGNRRAAIVLALLASSVLALGGGIWHQVLLHAPGGIVHSGCAGYGHAHAAHRHVHATTTCHAHSQHRAHASGAGAEVSRSAAPEESAPVRHLPHDAPAHDCSICTLLAAGATVTAPTTEWAGATLVARPHRSSEPARITPVSRAAPSLPRAPPVNVA